MRELMYRKKPKTDAIEQGKLVRNAGIFDLSCFPESTASVYRAFELAELNLRARALTYGVNELIKRAEARNDK